MNKYLISPLLLTLFLQGCGGSSSSTPPKPPEPVEYNFSLTSQLTNACGIASAFTDVELLLQDETWQTIKVYQPNENGEFSFITNDEFINYTLVAQDQQGSEAQGLNVVSFYQASSATPAHYQAQFDDLVKNDTCECVTHNLKVTHTPLDTLASVTSSAIFDSWEVVDNQNTLFKEVQVCRVIGGNWPLHSFSVEGVDSYQDKVAVGNFLKDTDINVSEGSVWSISAILSAKDHVLTSPYQDITNVQLIDGEKHFPTQAAKGDLSLLIFNKSKDDVYQSQASVTWVSSGSIFGTAVSMNKHQMISTLVDDSLSLMAGIYQPAFAEPFFDEIQEDGSYDYSAVIGYPMAIIKFTFRASDPATGLAIPAQWTFYGPEKGLLAISADLTGYDDIINNTVGKSAIDVRLVNSMATNNYQDYVKYYQGNPTAKMTSDFDKDMTAAELALKFK